MKIKELKELLNTYPEDLDVYILCEGCYLAFEASDITRKNTCPRSYQEEDILSILVTFS
jgi:hypothetical protein